MARGPSTGPGGRAVPRSLYPPFPPFPFPFAGVSGRGQTAAEREAARRERFCSSTMAGRQNLMGRLEDLADDVRASFFLPQGEGEGGEARGTHEGVSVS